MESLDDKLKKLIKEDLPKQVGEELQKVLAQAKIDAESVVSLKKELVELENTHNIVVKEVNDINGKLARHKSLDMRESELNELERNQKVSELTIKLDESEKRANMVQDFTSNLVRNTIVRESILDYESISVPGYYDQNNNWVPDNTRNVNKSYDKNTTKE